MERIPEGNGLEAARRGAGNFEGDLNRIGSAGGEQHFVPIAGRQAD
jgi:hypothetical protein